MSDLSEDDGWNGSRITKRKSESIDEFISRVLPSRTSSDVAPWIQIHDKNWTEDSACEHFDQFLDEVENIKKDIAEQIEKRENQTLKAIGSLARARILSTAANRMVLSGKWLLFPDTPDAIDGAWKIIAKETYAGTLGFSSKILTRNMSNNDKYQPQVICVYTKDFRDIQDVARVCKRLVELGCGSYVGCGDKRTVCAISYKPCAFTYADINTGNALRIKPTIYRRDDDFEALMSLGGIIEKDIREGSVVRKCTRSVRKRKVDTSSSAFKSKIHEKRQEITVDNDDDWW
jgi:hypothetical protein